jgi:hypothetical protein
MGYFSFRTASVAQLRRLAEEVDKPSSRSSPPGYIMQHERWVIRDALEAEVKRRERRKGRAERKK